MSYHEVTTAGHRFPAVVRRSPGLDFWASPEAVLAPPRREAAEHSTEAFVGCFYVVEGVLESLL
jgi:hypothetical protein